MDNTPPDKRRCPYCNEPTHPATGPCWHCDAGQGFAPADKVDLILGEGILRVCPHCHYDLAGNPGASHCPECGYTTSSNWTLFRLSQNRSAATLQFGPFTLRRLCQVFGCAAGVFVLCLLMGGGELDFGKVWYGSTATTSLEYATVLSMCIAIVALLVLAATCLVTLGAGRYEKKVGVEVDQPRLPLRTFLRNRFLGKVVIVLIIISFVLLRL